jgi:iron complex outermembrane receptor protein
LKPSKGGFVAASCLPARKAIVLASSVLLLSLVPAFGQNTPSTSSCKVLTGQPEATLTGTISDPSGARISSATVSLTCGGVRKIARTGPNGEYSVKADPGNYDLTIESPGFAVYQQVISIAAGSTAARDWTLKVGPAGSTVRVSADAGYVATDSSVGTKTNTPILETPQSISIVTRDQMNDQQPQSLNEALRYTPGIVPESEGVSSNFWSGSSLLLRGFVPEVYLDGLEDDGGGNDLIDSYFYQRVAILSGPSSVIYGQASPGGIVDVESKRPSTIPIHEVVFGLGSYDRYEGMVDLGSRIAGNDHFLYRVTGAGFTENTQTQFVNEQRMAIAPTFTWRPDAKTDLTLLSNYTYNPAIGQYAYVPAIGSALPNPYGKISTSLYIGDPNFNKTEQISTYIGDQFTRSLNAHWSLSEGLRYNVNNNHANMIWPSALEPDDQTLDRYSWIRNAAFNSLVNDDRITGDFKLGPIRQVVLAGVNYTHWHEHWTWGSNFNIPTLNIFDPDYYQQIAAPTDFSHELYNARQTGLYGQDQFSLGNWRLLVGGREDWVNASATYTGGSEALSPSKFTYRAGLNYVFHNGVSPYFSYSTSFQPESGTTATGAPLPSETGQQYEAGIKYQMPHLNSFFTTAVYSLAQQNVPTTDPANPNFEIPIGEIRSRGIEISDHTSLTHNLDLIASYTYTHSIYARSDDTAADLNGVQVPIVGKYQDGVPPQGGSVWANYTLHSGPASGLGFGGGVRAVGSSYGDEANSFEVPAFTLFDGTLHYNFSEDSPLLKGLRFQINASNIGDKSYVASCFSSEGCYFGLRRNVYATFSKSW